MNLRDLEYFVAVEKYGTFRSASEHCHVSQPTLSGQLKKLEEELGHPLFERSTRKVMLTDFGREALGLARDMLKKADELKQRAEALNDPFSGSIRIGVFPTLGPWLIPRLAGIFKTHYPKIRFYLTEEKTEILQEQLLNGEQDAVLLAHPQELPGVSVLPLFSEAFYAAVPDNHSWADRSCVDGADLEGEQLLLLGDGHCFRDQALDLCGKYGAREHESFRATGLETLRQMVRLGTGITLIPKLAVPEHDEPGIIYKPVSDSEFKRDIVLCFRKTHPRRTLWDNLAGVIRDHCGVDLDVAPLT